MSAFQPGQVVRLVKSPGTRGVAWGTPRADGLQRVSWSDGEMRYHRLDELRGDWRPAEIDQFGRDSIAVACPLCGAEPGETCTYEAGAYDMETGESLRRLQTFTRVPHHERVAVFTDGDLFGYTLRRLEQGR